MLLWRAEATHHFGRLSSMRLHFQECSVNPVHVAVQMQCVGFVLQEEAGNAAAQAAALEAQMAAEAEAARRDRVRASSPVPGRRAWSPPRCSPSLRCVVSCVCFAGAAGNALVS